MVSNVKQPQNSSGFTLVESIVSIVIIGMALLPIMALLSQSMTQLNNVAEANARAAAMESALAVIDPVNPLENPYGATFIGTTELLWSSEELVEPNETVQLRAGLAGYSVGFYKVTVFLRRNDAPWFSFETRKVGFRRIQPTDGPFTDTTNQLR